MRAFSRFTWIALGLAIAFTVGVIAAQWMRLPRITEEEVRQTVLTTIEREAPASFLVTGTLDLTATVTMQSEKTLLPGVLNLDLGTTTATVRAPGRATYGFDVRRLRPEHVRLEGDTLVVVTIPALEVLSVEPDLGRLDVQTDVGWARLESSSGKRMERAALARLNSAMRQQARAHVAGPALEPRRNTARAIRAMLGPAFALTGHGDLQFAFQLAPDLVMRGEE